MNIPVSPVTAGLVYLIVVAVMSVVCYVAYWIDKRRAVSGGRRTPETALQIIAFLGGWPGAVLAQRNLRHKTQKLSFRLVFWLVIFLHLGIIGAAGYVLFGSS